ncbi:MAG TPA: GH25 family lysozyme, partial [Candidatus Paceibacterota bacterium]
AWAAGAFGVIIKCGQGLGLDPMFRIYWSLAKFAGLKRSTYWYYDSRVDPEVQAKLWSDAIKDDPGEMPHFADYEETYGGKFAGIAMFTQFLIEFSHLSGLGSDKLGIYTGYYYWIDNGANDSFFSRYWLWLAWYTTAEAVKIPQPWTQDRLLLWQFTSSGDGNKYGASSAEIDLSYFVKGKDVFGQMFGNVTEVPTGDSMSQWFRVSAKDGLNIRKDAGGLKTGALPFGDVIEGLEKRAGWIRIGRVYRAGQLLELAPPNDPNNAWMSDSYLVATDAPVSDPVPTEPPPAGVKHTIDVYSDGSIRIDNGNPIP